MQDQEKRGVDKSMHKGHMQSDLMGGGRVFGFVVRVGKEGNQEKGTPEYEVGDGDHNKHFDAGDALALQFGEVWFDACTLGGVPVVEVFGALYADHGCH